MFRSWLYANLGTLYIICVLIIIGVSILTTPKVDFSEWFITLIGIGIVSFVLMFSFEPTAGPGVVLFVLVGGYFFLRWWLTNDPSVDLETRQTFQKANTVILVFSAVSLIPAFFIARYCNRNFDDVVSRRWMYRNSSKDVFESTWKYTVNRFLTSFEVIVALLLDIGIVWAVKNLDIVEKLLNNS